MPFPGAPKRSKLIIKPEEIATFNRNRLVDFIKTLILTEEHYGNKTEEIQKAVIAFYADRNAEEEADSKFYLTRYTQVIILKQFNIFYYYTTKNKCLSKNISIAT